MKTSLGLDRFLFPVYVAEGEDRYRAENPRESGIAMNQKGVETSFSTGSNSRVHPDPDCIALGIRQPWVELILRGIKKIEIRTLETLRRGKIYLYSGKLLDDRTFAHDAAAKHQIDISSLPLGKVVGSVEIVDCRPVKRADTEGSCVPFQFINSKQAWILGNPERFAPLPIRFRPFGVWFYPWKRMNNQE